MQIILRKGGPGSGDHGHAGRPGLVGGSQAKGSRQSASTATIEHSKKLTPFDTPEIIKARDEAKHIKSTHHINTPERKALRKEIINKLYGGGAKNKNKRIDIVLGPPAAGKSSVLADPLAHKHGSLILDSDMAKELLPEFNGGKGAGAVHEESSDIIEGEGGVFEKALENGDNLVLPIVGKSIDKVRMLRDKLKELGYSVHLHLNELAPEKAAERAVKRFEHTGRFVDPHYVLGVGTKPSENYEILKGEAGFDSYEKFSNDVPKGHNPILIEQHSNVRQHGEAGGRAAGRKVVVHTGSNDSKEAKKLTAHYKDEIRIVLKKGGPGSGDFNHNGRPGLVGGSEEQGGKGRRTKEHHEHNFVSLTNRAEFLMSQGIDEDRAHAYAHATQAFTGIDYTEIRQITSGTYIGDDLPEKERLTRFAKDLEFMIKELPKWGKSGALYRGVVIDTPIMNEFREAAKTGKPLSMLGLSSWSSSESVAKVFGHKKYGHGNGSTIFVLENGTMHGASIRAISEFEKENEVLLSSTTRFKITKIEDVDDPENEKVHTKIYVKEVKSGKFTFSKSVFLCLSSPLIKGGPGSGDFNHAGRPGLVGGSQETGHREGKTHRYGKEGHQGYEIPYNDKVNYFKGLKASSEMAERMATAVTKFSGSGSTGIRACQMGTFGGHHLEETYTKMGHDLEAAIKIMPKWADTSPLYRGMGIKTELMKKFIDSVGSGKVIDMRGTSSWSSSTNTAKSFSNHGDSGRAIFILDGGSKYATSIKHLSTHSGEDEVLMSKDARFTIVGHKVKNDIHYFTVKHKTKYAETNLDEVENLPPVKLTPKQELEKENWSKKQEVYKKVMSDYNDGTSTHVQTKQKLAALLSGKNYGDKAYDDIYSQGMSAMKSLASEKYSKFVPTPDNSAKKVIVKGTNQTSVMDQIKKELTEKLTAQIVKDSPYKYSKDQLENATLTQLGEWAHHQIDDEHVGMIGKSHLIQKILDHPMNKVTKDKLEGKGVMELVEYAKKLGSYLPEKKQKAPKKSDSKEAIIKKILAHPKNTVSKETLSMVAPDNLDAYYKGLDHMK